MTTLHEAVQQAIKALDGATRQMLNTPQRADCYSSMEELRSALAQQGEPPEYPASPMTAKRAAYFMERFKKEEKLLGPNEQAAVDFVLEMLAQQGEQQPVGSVDYGCEPHRINWEINPFSLPDGTPLYAGAAPAAQPGKNEIKQLVIKYGLECMANHGTGPSVQAAWQDFIIALG